MSWIICIDGGGTKCKAGLFDEAGNLVATAISGPANLFTNFSSSCDNILLACDELVVSAHQQNINVSVYDCSLLAACAGGERDEVRQQFASWEHPFAKASLVCDVNAACMGANQGQDCTLFIVGTGSSMAVLQQQRITQYGGHGFVLGDCASGAWLGKQAVQWFLIALENGHNDTVLFDVLVPVLGENASNIVSNYAKAMPHKFAEIAPVLVENMRSSHTVSAWMQQGVDYLCNMLNAHHPIGNPVFLYGGLCHIYLPLLKNACEHSVAIANQDPLHGAYAIAKNELLGG